ncbi:hypothetical protein ACQRBV_17465 [Pseudomonas sp. R11F]|nr:MULTISPECIES: hypothetical protein [Pseudomonas]KAB0569831.1 hypothetical protein F7R03_01520 [Pseudomonas palleroniana]MBM9484863.1 hypothetical protein [Pseudomonas sp. ICBG1301]PTC31354.1 hypothetical protein C9383_03790 [Pseudomonas palleroniana]SEE98509.1 hypothetical protein SAMN04490198_4070 [Pseudomonas palleroniana]
MINNDDLRFESHKHLLEIDASVAELMKLVASRKTAGVEWVQAIARYDAAHSKWVKFLLDAAISNKS